MTPRKRTRPAAPPQKDARDRLRRVLFLVPYAVRNSGIRVKDLARKCGVTEQEVLDDLDFLLGVGCPPFAPDDFLDLYVEGDNAPALALYERAGFERWAIDVRWRHAPSTDG